MGGFLNFGEDPEKGAKREMKEETGCEIKILDLIGVYMDEYDYQGEIIPTLNLVYVAKIIKGEIKVSDDVADVFWQPIGKIPNNLSVVTAKDALIDLEKWSKNNENN